MQLVFEQIRVGGDRNFGYLLGDRDAQRAVLIDPSYSPEAVVERAQVQGMTISHVINTHGHDDHTNGNARAAALTGASIAAHAAALSRPDVEFDDGQELLVGGFQLQCLHVPGHCDDHLVLYESVSRILITGDLLFVGKVGGTKTDADARVEWTSLQRILKVIPDQATIWPGHDYGARPSSTIALEKATNPFLACEDAGAFVQFKADWSRFKSEHGLK
jgi:hydroxyacylglutathione hydrolase